MVPNSCANTFTGRLVGTVSANPGNRRSQGSRVSSKLAAVNRAEPTMFEAPPHRYRVDPASFTVADAASQPPANTPDEKELKDRLEQENQTLARWQRKLYAHDQYALLLVFQAMDAAGKDSTIRKVLSGVNPAGCQVFSFKRPSSEELDHDFLWRTARRLPERGRIGVFNRSYYEEVLVVRIHPQILANQRLPAGNRSDAIFEQRFESICDHEKHLARNGTVILKFWLNVSREEQRRRFLSRLEDPDKHWKFEPHDLKEAAHWSNYMNAYEECIRATDRPWAPWYAIPADDKPYMRFRVAQIINEACTTLTDVEFPKVAADDRDENERLRQLLLNGDA